MKHVELLPHPDTPGAPLESLRVEVTHRADGGLGLTYRLAGDLDSLLIPKPSASARRDGLWRHTCCEAFVMADAGPAYREFNFAPSGDWQAYAFNAYRQGGPLEAATPPGIAVERAPRQLIVQVTLARAMLPAGQTWRLGLSAVIETRAGAIAYWALRHAPGKPDFHHTDAFALELA